MASTRSELAVAEAALHSLAPVDQELLRLSLWDELSNPEIAIVLDLEPDAVRSKLFRARQRFQAALEIDLRDKSAEPDTKQASDQDRQGPHSGRNKGTSL